MAKKPWYRTWRLRIIALCVIAGLVGIQAYTQEQARREIGRAVHDGVDDSAGSAWREVLGEPPRTISSYTDAPASSYATPSGVPFKAYPSASYTPTATPTSKVYRLNDAVVTRPLTYTVTKVRTGISTVGTGTESSNADGAFVLVNLTIKNTSSTEEYFYSSRNTRLYDGQGGYYAPDEAAERVINDWRRAGYVSINPGETVQVVLAYDLPTEVAPSQLGVIGYSEPHVRISIS